MCGGGGGGGGGGRTDVVVVLGLTVQIPRVILIPFTFHEFSDNRGFKSQDMDSEMLLSRASLAELSAAKWPTTHLKTVSHLGLNPKCIS